MSETTEAQETWRVARTAVGDVEVSTVSIANEGDRLGFETMIFGGDHDHEQERYPTRDLAVAGHARWVELVTP